MTRLRALFLGALITGTTAGPAAGQITLGMSAGASLSDLVFTGIEIDEREPRRGIVAGASVTVPVSGPFALQIGGSLAQRGATITLAQLGDAQYELGYVQLSALGRASLPLGGSRSSLYLLAGPVFAWETGCEVTVTSVLLPGSEMTTCDDERLQTPSRPVDYALAGGAGARLAVTGRWDSRWTFSTPTECGPSTPANWTGRPTTGP